MLIVSYATPDYLPFLRRMQESASALGYSTFTEVRADRGSWEANCAQKAEFILEAWESHNQPICWIDADAIVQKRLVLMETALAVSQSDFGAYILTEKTKPRWDQTQPRLRLRSGTLWFAQTPVAGKMLCDWVDRCAENPDIWDQEHLYYTWSEDWGEEPRTLYLPLSYCQRFDESSAGLMSPDDAHVLHLQASRDRKK